MPNENQKNPRNNLAVRQLPWLLGVVMLVIYLFTLNPWVSLLNIMRVAAISGWTWQPQVTSPLSYLVTLPFHLLPAGKIPVCLNLFSALCAAVVLALLARCVAILPHDRTDTERQRERSDFSFLTGSLAIYPPILAVSLIGFQLGFWQHATNFTGESFDLLLFAVIIWQLLEYRLDEAPWRLYLSAFVYGAGIAESWVFVGYFPVLVTAVIWVRKWDFFNLQFLARMTWCGLGGISFLFWLPLSTALSGTFHLSFWDALRPALSEDWSVISSLSYNFVWHQLALVSLSTLLPVLAMSIRWSSNFGDSSHAGSTLVNYLFYFIHAAFFTVCVWVMFDPPISPKLLAPGLSPFFGSSALTFYYLAALGIGYYCGYYLLVFGKSPVRSRRNARPDPALPRNLMWLCPVIVGATFTCAALAIGLLLYKNVPAIRAFNDGTLLKYAQFSTRNLPAGGAILLGDVDTQKQPVHGYIIQAMLARERRTKNYPVVNTLALQFSPYQLYLQKKFSDIWPQLFKEKQPVIINQLGLLSLMNLLARSNNISYLNPSFGYYFESFYQEPHGLNYTMKLLPAKTLMPPPLDQNLIAENEKFWSEVVDSVSPTIEKTLAPAAPNRRLNFADWLLAHLHATVDPNPNALYAATLYSRALDSWGVQLQRAGELDRAATNFIAAQNLNPDNVTAGVNLDFNRKLRAGKISAIDPSRISPDQFGKSRSWQELLDANGPFDEISFTFHDGLVLAGNGYYRQAIVPFARVRQLAPDFFGARLQLAQAYIFARMPDRALEALHDPMTDPARFSLPEGNTTSISILLAAAYFQQNENARATDVLEREIQRHPDDETLLRGSVQAFLLHGLYTNALAVIAHKLTLTPDDPKWIFAKGYVEMQSTNYAAAVASLTRVLEIESNNPTALFNRALAYLDSGNLDAARTDYSQLQSGYTNSVQVAYGLGEIAWRQHNTNEAIRNYEIYLANARTDTAEATNVINRLRELKK